LCTSFYRDKESCRCLLYVFVRRFVEELVEQNIIQVIKFIYSSKVNLDLKKRSELY
jgi:hypothetical protein